MRLIGTLSAFAALLVACDTSEPDVFTPPTDDAAGDHPAELVDTWGLYAETFETLVTSPVAQTYTDLDRAPTVDGQVSGDETFALLSAWIYQSDDATYQVELASYDLSQGQPSSGDYATLSVTSRADVSSLSLRIRQDGQYRYFDRTVEGHVVVRDGPTLRLAPVTFEDYAGGPDWTAEAEVTYATTELQAGVPARLRLQRNEPWTSAAGRPVLRYTLRADGTLRSERDDAASGSASVVWEGLWATRGDLLRLENPGLPLGSAYVQRYTYALAADTLRLSSPTFRCGDTDCLQHYSERGALTTPLSDYQIVRSDLFIPTEAPFVRSPHPTPAQ